MKKDEENIVEIYHRILKYSPFSLKRKPGMMKHVHHLSDGGEIIVESTEYVTVEDGEKLFWAVLLSKGTKTFGYHGIRVVAGRFHISELRRVTNCNDDDYLLKCLLRNKKLVITYKSSHNTTTTSLLHEVQVDEAGIVTCLFNALFYQNCIQHSLKLNMNHYSTLSPATKNLYAFLISNSGDLFSEDLLLERMVLIEGRKDNKQTTLKRSLNELKKKSVIFDYRLVKYKGKRYYKITRFGRNVQTYPQH